MKIQMKQPNGEFYTRDGMYMRVDPTPIPVRSGLADCIDDAYAINQLRKARVCGRYLNACAPWTGLVDAAYIGTFKRIKRDSMPRHIYNILMEG